MFKKWLSIILCGVMLSIAFSAVMTASAAPAESVAFSLSATEGTVGDTVTVSLSISENSRFANATMYLHYNPEAVTYVAESVQAGSSSPKSATMFDAKDHKNNSFVKCGYITGGVVTKGGVLLTFDFEVIADIPAAFSLSFDECQGEAEDGTIFDVQYEITGCVLNNDGSVQVPTGDPVVTTTTVVPVTTTTASSPLVTEGEDQYGSTNATTMSTMVVTDEGNNKITIPVVTTTDASGNAATVPVAVVTDAKGTTVTVPVVIVTDTAGSVATIPVADGTDAEGNDVTIPVAIVTDTEGNVETVPVATATDAKGSIVTVPITTSATAPVAENGGLTTGIVIVVICGIVAVVVAFAATKLRKKSENG